MAMNALQWFAVLPVLSLLAIAAVKVYDSYHRYW
jgi:hypothetical protein